MQVEELTCGIICGADSLSAFFTANTNSNVSFHNHGNIICTVTDGKSDPFSITFGKCNDISFLFGRNTAADD